MKITTMYTERSAARRLVALLGTITLCVGVVALTPVAQASPSGAASSAASGAADGTDESNATGRDDESEAPRGDEVEEAAPTSSSAPKVAKGWKFPRPRPHRGRHGGSRRRLSLFRLCQDPQDGFAFCGATLVSSIWVLTAAHCVDGGTTPASLKLVIGAWQLNDESPGGVRSVTRSTSTRAGTPPPSTTTSRCSV